MREWAEITLVVTSAGILFILLIVSIRRCCFPVRPKHSTNSREQRDESLQAGLAKLHHLDPDSMKKAAIFHRSRRGFSSNSLFSWFDQPSFVTEAVENGWSRFAFTTYSATPSVRSARSLLGVCAAYDQRNGMEVEISWEVCQGSSDFMQKVRLNSGLRNTNTNVLSMGSAISVIRTSLPLPGPPLGNSSFPQEAYFEITILSSHQDDLDPTEKAKGEGEKARLIQENLNGKANSDSSVHGNNKLDELKSIGMENGKEEPIVLSLGLTVGGYLPLRLPGNYPRSIGFNSDGSVYLDGLKLVYGSDKQKWGRANEVIGCGYNPSHGKVFFTVDSELVHVINCKSEEFGSPLYPVLAANIDTMVLVNLGQSGFKFAPANAHRTPNPCFIGPMASSPALGYDDSKELFSMGRIDSQWLNRSTIRGTYSNSSNFNYDEESEGDLFEIVLDSSGKSTNTVL